MGQKYTKRPAPVDVQSDKRRLVFFFGRKKRQGCVKPDPGDAFPPDHHNGDNDVMDFRDENGCGTGDSCWLNPIPPAGPRDFVIYSREDRP